MAISKHFEVDENGDLTVIRFVEPKLFDHLLLTELQDQLMGFIESETPARLLIDFGLVEFCSTSLINTLLRVKKHIVSDNRGKMVLCAMRTNVREAFQMLNLDGTVFQIHDDRQSAEDSM